MTSKNRKKPAGKSANSEAKPQAQTQPTKSKKPAYVSRFVGIDTHLAERNGATKQVQGIAGERPAGRKFADDIAKICCQLDAEGYEVIAIFPLTSGRVVKASVESEGRTDGTYTHHIKVPDPNFRWAHRMEEHYYIDTGAGYSVTDGVVITAKLRQ